MIEIGFRAHDFGSFASIEELAQTVSQYRKPAVIHLALNKVVPSARKWQEWDEEYISSIRDTLASYGIRIVITGCYINPVHPDPEKRAEHITRFKRSLDLTKAFGCRVIGTETGSWTPNISYTPDTYEPEVFDVFLKSLDEMLNHAVKRDAIVGIEPVSYHHTICTPERMIRVLEKFPDEHLKVIYDPINLVPKWGIAEADGSIRRRPSDEAQKKYFIPILDAFQDRLCAIHAKDYILTAEGQKKGDEAILTGAFDWKDFLCEVAKRKLDLPMTLENFKPETLKETVKTLEEYLGQ